MDNANFLAFAILAVWPLVSIVFFKRFDALTAAFCTILWGFLLLPVRVVYDFPLIPPLDKQSICAICSLVFLRLFKKTPVSLLPGTILQKFLILVYLLVPLITVRNNTEAILWRDGTILPGLSFYDGLSSSIDNFLEIIPFLVAVQLVRSYEDQVKIFKLILFAGLAYTLPILAEIRLSPQLHTWVYGFFPHDFSQQMRSGGFRPVVFLGHGLVVSMFLVLVVGCAMAFWKGKLKESRLPNGTVTGAMFVVLVLSKGLGATIYAIFIGLVMRFTGIRLSVMFAAGLATLLLLYPLLMTNNMFPHELLVETAEKFDPKRAQSLEFRFDHEADLVEHALKKPYFGWGSWGRNRLENSVTDGYWVILMGEFGLVGFLAIALLLWITILKCIRAARHVSDRKASIVFAAHALIVAVIVVDQIPNDSMHMVSWFMVGALAGRCLGALQLKRKEAVSPEPSESSQLEQVQAGGGIRNQAWRR